ncbi:porin [Ralstonia insidiosa]|uniref:Uncharacterized protein n=1 Tax=Ralstonia insidiosa TaxID=190721 RepID=A0A192A2T0_9RALS|nr:porin [Ralstonia insidiosa]ANJ74648.1 hypothetical protein A9Y76_18845 [Ralstonia insidiosa]KAB0469051.1 porin [Ralstonia insidiosa]MBY4909710.1 porin [Ralstonia insidiosa]
MKRHAIAFAVLGTCAGAAAAQSSVTLYGVIDQGINYTNNSGGNSLVEMASGHVQGSRFGLRGSEDLGGGTKAIFQLENGFSADTGRLGQGGRMFGRQAYVGLSNNQLGTVTLGRQYDSVVDYFAGTTANGNWAGWQFAHPLDNDNTDNSFRLDNTIKYASPVFGGFQFGGAYAFSEDASFSNNRVYSFGGKYANGGLVIGTGYMVGNNIGQTDGGALAANDVGAFAAKKMRVFGAGINYTTGPTTVGFAYSNSNYNTPTGSGYLGSAPGAIAAAGVTVDAVKYHNFEVSGKYQITPAFFLGGQYVLSLMKYDASTGRAVQRIHTVGLMADYNFSKRTDVYLQTSYQHVAGGKTDSLLDGGYVLTARAPSSTANQAVVRLALRHKF